MQNFSHNNSQPDDGQGNDDKQDKSRQKNDIQREMIMLESDYRKAMTEKTNLEMEIRQLKKDEDHIKIDMQEKKTRLGKVEYDLLQLDNAQKSLKKKLNLIQ